MGFCKYCGKWEPVMWTTLNPGGEKKLFRFVYYQREILGNPTNFTTDNMTDY